MPKKQQRTFTKEFKVQAVSLATQPGNTISQIARDLGIGSQTLGRWITQVSQTDRPAFTGRGVQALTEQEKRIKDLERENAILRQEREILKTAAKFFLTPHQHLRAWVAS
jgi:transposase